MSSSLNLPAAPRVRLAPSTSSKGLVVAAPASPSLSSRRPSRAVDGPTQSTVAAAPHQATPASPFNASTFASPQDGLSHTPPAPRVAVPPSSRRDSHRVSGGGGLLGASTGGPSDGRDRRGSSLRSPSVVSLTSNDASGAGILRRTGSEDLGSETRPSLNSGSPIDRTSQHQHRDSEGVRICTSQPTSQPDVVGDEPPLAEPRRAILDVFHARPASAQRSRGLLASAPLPQQPLQPQLPERLQWPQTTAPAAHCAQGFGGEGPAFSINLNVTLPSVDTRSQRNLAVRVASTDFVSHLCHLFHFRRAAGGTESQLAVTDSLRFVIEHVQLLPATASSSSGSVATVPKRKGEVYQCLKHITAPTETTWGDVCSPIVATAMTAFLSSTSGVSSDRGVSAQPKSAFDDVPQGGAPHAPQGTAHGIVSVLPTSPLLMSVGSDVNAASTTLSSSSGHLAGKAAAVRQRVGAKLLSESASHSVTSDAALRRDGRRSSAVDLPPGPAPIDGQFGGNGPEVPPPLIVFHVKVYFGPLLDAEATSRCALELEFERVLHRLRRRCERPVILVAVALGLRSTDTFRSAFNNPRRGVRPPRRGPSQPSAYLDQVPPSSVAAKHAHAAYRPTAIPNKENTRQPITEASKRFEAANAGLRRATDAAAARFNADLEHRHNYRSCSRSNNMDSFLSHASLDEDAVLSIDSNSGSEPIGPADPRAAYCAFRTVLGAENVRDRDLPAQHTGGEDHDNGAATIGLDASSLQRPPSSYQGPRTTRFADAPPSIRRTQATVGQVASRAQQSGEVEVPSVAAVWSSAQRSVDVIRFTVEPAPTALQADRHSMMSHGDPELQGPSSWLRFTAGGTTPIRIVAVELDLTKSSHERQRQEDGGGQFLQPVFSALSDIRPQEFPFVLPPSGTLDAAAAPNSADQPIAPAPLLFSSLREALANSATDRVIETPFNCQTDPGGASRCQAAGEQQESQRPGALLHDRSGAIVSVDDVRQTAGLSFQGAALALQEIDVAGYAAELDALEDSSRAVAKDTSAEKAAEPDSDQESVHGLRLAAIMKQKRMAFAEFAAAYVAAERAAVDNLWVFEQNAVTHSGPSSGRGFFDRHHPSNHYHHEDTNPSSAAGEGGPRRSDTVRNDRLMRQQNTTGFREHLVDSPHPLTLHDNLDLKEDDNHGSQTSASRARHNDDEDPWSTNAVLRRARAGGLAAVSAGPAWQSHVRSN